MQSKVATPQPRQTHHRQFGDHYKAFDNIELSDGIDPMIELNDKERALLNQVG